MMTSAAFFIAEKNYQFNEDFCSLFHHLRWIFFQSEDNRSVNFCALVFPILEKISSIINYHMSFFTSCLKSNLKCEKREARLILGLCPGHVDI